MKENTIQRYSVLREDYSELFNCNDLGFCIYKTSIRSKTNLHYHDFYEVEIITKGECVQNLNGISETISGGNITFLTLSDCHGFYDISAPVDGYTIHFTESNISPQLLSLLGDVQGTSFSPTTDVFDEICGECARLLEAYLSLNPMRSILIRNILERILIIILRNVNTDINYCPSDMQEVIDYIKKNFRNDISRKDIAKMLWLNENYLSTKFKKTFGISIQKFINKSRIIHARNMLISTNLSVNQIAFSSGYKSVSQFYRIFRSEFGVSPLEYKHNNIGK